MAKGLSALVADKEPGIRALLKEFLGQLGFTVVEAGLSRHALSLITENDFSVVQLEDELSGSSSLSFYEEAFSLRPALRKRFIFMTCGLPDAPNVLRACQLIRKPFDFLVLEKTVREVVER